MLRVTERARRRLKELIDSDVSEPGASVRIDAAGATLGLFADRVQADDCVVEHASCPVLLVSGRLAAQLYDCTLDYEDSPVQGFTLLPPSSASHEDAGDDSGLSRPAA